MQLFMNKTLELHYGESSRIGGELIVLKIKIQLTL